MVGGWASQVEIIAWHELEQYLRDQQATVIADLPSLDGIPLYKALGALAVLTDMLNLPATLDMLHPKDV